MTFDQLFKNNPIQYDTNKTSYQKDQETFQEIRKVFEGRDIKSILSKEYPEVIAQLQGPKPPEDSENGYYKLQMVVVPFKLRENGLATNFFKRLIILAKKEKKDIFLTPDDAYQEDDGMTKGQLTQWYKKLGFEKKHKDDFRSQDTYCYYS